MIVASALKFYVKDKIYPMIITGLCHADCYEKLHDMKIDYKREGVEEGFFTEDNQFLDRIKAKRLALHWGQVKDKDNDCPALYSEDIWPEQEDKNNPIEYVELIKDICVDYDGFNTIQGLKSLVDEIGHYARLALKGMIKD